MHRYYSYPGHWNHWIVIWEQNNNCPVEAQNISRLRVTSCRKNRDHLKTKDRLNVKNTNQIYSFHWTQSSKTSLKRPARSPGISFQERPFLSCSIMMKSHIMMPQLCYCVFFHVGCRHIFSCLSLSFLYESFKDANQLIQTVIIASVDSWLHTPCP